MPKIQNITTDPDFTVTKQPLYNRDGEVLKGHFGTFREGVKEPLGIVADRYKVVNYMDILNPVEEALDGLGMTDYDKRVRIVGNGERMYTSYTFKNRVAKVKSVGDEVGFRLTAVGSHDRTNRLKFLMGLLRLVCTNGMVTLKPEFSMSRLHSNRLNIGFVQDAIRNAVAGFEKSTAMLDVLAKQQVTQAAGRIIIGNLDLTKPIVEGVTKVWNDPTYQDDSERNLYNLYNAATEHLSNEVEETRYEYAQGRNRSVLTSLLKASRDDNAFAALLKEPKPENN
jgi:hypothetical protein